MVSIFISYTREDLAFVKRLINDMDSSEIEIWVDHEKIRPGTPDWENSVRDGIRASDAIVFIASPESALSLYTRDELRIARDNGKLVYPIWANGKIWSDCIPLGWGSIQYVDARESKYETAIYELTTQLVKDFSPKSIGLNEIQVEKPFQRAFQLGLISLREAKQSSEINAVRAAIVYFTAVLEWVTPETWPALYLEVRSSLQESQWMLNEMNKIKIIKDSLIASIRELWLLHFNKSMPDDIAEKFAKQTTSLETIGKMLDDWNMLSIDEIRKRLNFS